MVKGEAGADLGDQPGREPEQPAEAKVDAARAQRGIALDLFGLLAGQQARATDRVAPEVAKASSRTKPNVARMSWSWPISGSSARNASAWGWWRHMKASERIRPAASAASKAWSTSAGLNVYGFSHRTCLPACTAASVQG